MLAAILAVVTVFYGLTQTGSGDSTRVRGTVTTGTPNGRRVPNAWVTATSGSDVRVTRADARGDYVFLTLLPGVYHLSALPAAPERNAGLIELHGGATGFVTLLPPCRRDDESLLELSAGIEYQANLDLRRSCR